MRLVNGVCTMVRAPVVGLVVFDQYFLARYLLFLPRRAFVLTFLCIRLAFVVLLEQCQLCLECDNFVISRTALVPDALIIERVEFGSYIY